MSQSVEVVKILRGLALSIETEGFPTEPVIIQTDPEDELCMFIALWTNKGDRKLDKIKVELNTRLSALEE